MTLSYGHTRGLDRISSCLSSCGLLVAASSYRLGDLPDPVNERVERGVNGLGDFVRARSVGQCDLDGGIEFGEGVMESLTWANSVDAR